MLSYTPPPNSIPPQHTQKIFLSLTVCNLNLRAHKPWAGRTVCSQCYLCNTSLFSTQASTPRDWAMHGATQLGLREKRGIARASSPLQCSSRTCFFTQFPKLTLSLILRTYYMGLHLSVKMVQGVCQEYCATHCWHICLFCLMSVITQSVLKS